MPQRWTFRLRTRDPYAAKPFARRVNSTWPHISMSSVMMTVVKIRAGESRQLFCEFETIETTNDQMKPAIPLAFQSKILARWIPLRYFSLKSPYSNISVFVLHRMDYYLNIRDIQTLGMLSCVLAHHALSDAFKPPRSSFNTEVIPSSMSFPFGSPPSFNNDTPSQVILQCFSKLRFWATDGNRKWTFCIPGHWSLPNFQTNDLYYWKYI